MKRILIVMTILVLGACKKDPPSPPSAVELVFPEENSECTTGESLNATTSLVEFRWDASANTDLYEVSITNKNTNSNELVSVEETSVKITLEKGGLYEWSVTSENDNTTDKVASATWQFYNSGAQTTYAPFPAHILFPASGQTVVEDLHNEINLDWLGADIDNDIASYEVYFSTVSPPLTLVSSQTNNTAHKVTVSSGVAYFWKVITLDSEGNSSDSGIFEFKVN